MTELGRTLRVMNQLELLFPRHRKKLELRWANFDNFRQAIRENNLDSTGLRELGLYVGGNKPYALVLDSEEEIPHNLIAAHEIGHYIDNVLLEAVSPGGSTSWFSQTCPHLEGVCVKLQESWTLTQLRKMRNEGGHLPDKYVDYLLRPEEVFARAFAQYITVKSSDSSLSEELAPYLEEGGALELTQWHPTDFQQILVAFDDFFLALKGTYAAS
jgi:hypothetical protein